MHSAPPPIRDAKSLEAELDKFPHLRKHPKFEKLRADCDTYFHTLAFKKAYEHGKVTLVEIAKQVGTSDTQVGRWIVKAKEPRLLWHLNHERTQATTCEHFHYTHTHQHIPQDPILRAANDPECRQRLLPRVEFTPTSVDCLLRLRSDQTQHRNLTHLTSITSYSLYEAALHAFPLIQTLPSFDQLHKHVQLYFRLQANPPHKANGKLPIGALCHHYNVTKACIHNWLNNTTQPQLKTLLEQRAQTLNTYHAQLHDLRKLDNGIITLHDLNNRLSPTHFYFWEHISTDPAFDQQLTDATRYLAILQLVEHGHHPVDLDRYFNLHKDYTGDTLRYHHRPHLIQLASTIPPNQPTPNHQWLPTTTGVNNYPTRYITAPYTITNWQQLPSLLQQLPTLQHPDNHLQRQLNTFELNPQTLHHWTQQYGPIRSPQDRLLAFAYLIGTSLSDGWIQQQSTLSSSFGLELSKKYKWAPIFGNRTAYFWTSLGFPVKQGEGRKINEKRPHGAYNWYSITSPFLTYFNEVILGFQPGQTHTDTPAKINWVLEAPKEFQIKVIQGLFDGDGWANRTLNEIGIHSHKNRDIIQRLLLQQGIDVIQDGDFELVIHSNQGIIAAANLPIFLSSLGRHKRAMEAAQMAGAPRFSGKIYHPEVIRRVIELFQQGISKNKIRKHLFQEQNLVLSNRAINRIIRDGREGILHDKLKVKAFFLLLERHIQSPSVPIYQLVRHVKRVTGYSGHIDTMSGWLRKNKVPSDVKLAIAKGYHVNDSLLESYPHLRLYIV